MIVGDAIVIVVVNVIIEVIIVVIKMGITIMIIPCERQPNSPSLKTNRSQVVQNSKQRMNLPKIRETLVRFPLFRETAICCSST